MPISPKATSGRLLPHVQPRVLIVPGLIVAASGLALLTQLDAASDYLSLLLPAQLLLGAGIGCVFTPAIDVVTTGIERSTMGIAAATATTAMQLGGSIGVAALNTIAVAATGTYLSTHRTRAGAAALAHGYATAALWAAVVLMAAAGVALVMIRQELTDE